MKTIFDPTVRKELLERANRLTLQSERRWGSMRSDQGLHHINAAFQLYLGELTSPYHGNAALAAIARLVTFSPIPIPREKGRTAPSLIADKTYDLADEKARMAQLLERVATRPVNASWPVHPFFGQLTGEQYGKLGYKHTDHHLKQFGV
ncbi:MAG: DUF1569 domain-containing protein [Bacteroidota bacterium]|nr:DUF1569 domain-containing protein [Bacteroidota bacterium]MDP4232764.1 DUF1569 domain-containing protein [Bacteroidota bacterium]MDP4242554.1 DUF1569 domain-containing protein [Bacteroidota bacterium]MDP4289371.1 DUF1569 domain-containing protein [Bacteroidota bacterium]